MNLSSQRRYKQRKIHSIPSLVIPSLPNCEFNFLPLKMSSEQIKPIIPSQGIVIYEEKSFFILCKPKLLSLKSLTLEKLEKIEKKIEKDNQDKANQQSDNNQ